MPFFRDELDDPDFDLAAVFDHALGALGASLLGVYEVPIEEMSDERREAAYFTWWQGVREHRRRYPLLRLPAMDTNELAAELQKGGIQLSTDCTTVLVRHHEAVILIEIPLAMAGRYALTDLVTHAAFLIARMRTHSPRRVRLEQDMPGEFYLAVVE